MKIIEKKDFNFIFYLLALAIFFAFLTFTISGEEGAIRLLQLRNTKKNLEVQNMALLHENLAYRQQQLSLHNLKTIERQARESLGLVYPDELTYIVNNNNGHL